MSRHKGKAQLEMPFGDFPHLSSTMGSSETAEEARIACSSFEDSSAFDSSACPNEHTHKP